MSAAVEVCRQRKEPAGSYPVPLLDSPSQVGLHLAGHSFGAWLVTAAAAKRDQLWEHAADAEWVVVKEEGRTRMGGNWFHHRWCSRRTEPSVRASVTAIVVDDA
jgi:pimeloyl-ACP methyl ester carboxylesterase